MFLTVLPAELVPGTGDSWGGWPGVCSVAQRPCPAQQGYSVLYMSAAGTNHPVSEPLGAPLLPGEELHATLEGSVT